jgi:hypothetical protein
MYIQNFDSQKENLEPEDEFEEGLTPEEDKIAQGIGRILFHWKAPEYENYERDRKWYVVMTLALVAIITYAFFTNSPIMAITFILIGIIEYIYISREPEMLDFAITEKGIVVGREIYEFESINSFWIFYNPEIIKSLSLHTKNNIFPFVQIPLHNEDPEEVRSILLQLISEKKQEPRFADTLNRILRL